MKTALLQRFVALVDEDVHFPRAADALGIPLASLYSSIDKLEAEVGHPLFTRTKSGMVLTGRRRSFFSTRRSGRSPHAPPPVAKPVVPAGGKAKASKGKGRTPAVKGQPKPYKKRQGR